MSGHQRFKSNVFGGSGMNVPGYSMGNQSWRRKMNDASAANSSSDFAESTQREANHHGEEVGKSSENIGVPHENLQFRESRPYDDFIVRRVIGEMVRIILERK